MKNLILAYLLAIILFPATSCPADDLGLRLSWEKNILTISGSGLPGGQMKVLYMEAYCRPGSTDRKWEQTTIGHTTRLLSADANGKRLELQCTLSDGVIVHHDIRAGADEIVFNIEASNPTDKASEAQWAQPCVRVDAFAGRDKNTYLDKCFIFLNGKLTRMPTPRWSTAALYTPGQVWCPANVSRNDVNPRPLSPDVPSNGLIGCFSADEKMVMAIAFEPYQELFQGVIACIHSDFRIGGLKPGESRKIRGKIYFVGADIPKLLTRYHADFPEHGP